jgi:hypothetical protein
MRVDTMAPDLPLMPQQQPIPPDFGEARLDALQRGAFDYFLHHTNLVNGLVADTTREDSVASIAAVGFALATYPVGVARGWMTRSDALQRTLAVLRFFWASPHSTAPDATGHKGFYYHFLEMDTGRRAGLCELSTVDSSFLLAGMLAAAAYFVHENEDEQAVRTLVDALGVRWRCNGHARMEARKRFSGLPLGRLRRGGPAVHPGIGITDAPSAARELCGMDLHL